MATRQDEIDEERRTLLEYMRVDNLREPRRSKMGRSEPKHDQLTEDLATIGRNAIDEIIAMRGQATALERKVEDAIGLIHHLRHQRRVMADILGDALAVIQTIEGENTDEADRLRALRNRMSAAISRVAQDDRRNDEPAPLV